MWLLLDSISRRESQCHGSRRWCRLTRLCGEFGRESTTLTEECSLLLAMADKPVSNSSGSGCRHHHPNRQLAHRCCVSCGIGLIQGQKSYFGCSRRRQQLPQFSDMGNESEPIKGERVQDMMEASSLSTCCSIGGDKRLAIHTP